MNKTTIIVVCFISLCITQNAQSVLTVLEMVPGQKVTLDTVTGNYWYWNLEDFIHMYYWDQTTAIADLGNYGNIAGGWHMATPEEMESLWAYDGASIGGAFAPSIYYSIPDVSWWSARYEAVPGPPATIHFVGEIVWNPNYTGWTKYALIGPWIDDGYAGKYSAWVTSDHHVVPVSGSLILAATGLLSMLGLKRLRRKR